MAFYQISCCYWDPLLLCLVAIVMKSKLFGSAMNKREEIGLFFLLTTALGWSVGRRKLSMY